MCTATLSRHRHIISPPPSWGVIGRVTLEGRLNSRLPADARGNKSLLFPFPPLPFPIPDIFYSFPRVVGDQPCCHSWCHGCPLIDGDIRILLRYYLRCPPWSVRVPVDNFFRSCDIGNGKAWHFSSARRVTCRIKSLAFCSDICFSASATLFVRAGFRFSFAFSCDSCHGGERVGMENSGECAVRWTRLDRLAVGSVTHSRTRSSRLRFR